jgi:hypothetical protein
MNLALTVLIYVVASFLVVLEALILWKMTVNKIDLKYLIADAQGDASLSRFQFLLFTFVIAVGFVYLTIKGGGFPRMDEGVLILLGISGAGYALGKGLEKSESATPAPETPPPPEP